MIELMHQSAVPANLMRTAAKGALALPPEEMIEVLVFLTHNAMFGEQARMTLAGWDEAACLKVCADPNTPADVLKYMFAAENRRPALAPVLIENLAIADEKLMEMAEEPSSESVQFLLASQRAIKTPNVMRALLSNPLLTPPETYRIQTILGIDAEPPEPEAQPEPQADPETDEALVRFQTEHAAEIAAEEGKQFELMPDEEEAEHAAAPEATTPPAAQPPAPTATPQPVAQVPAPAKPKEPQEKERISVLQKISRLSVGERVQLGMKGTKDERFILIRDGSKVVSSAVLASPKVSDQEIETFASMKNVQESVLRGIAMNRKFMKNYAVLRNLTANPRCPLDIQLTLVKNLLNQDLRNLSMNKNVSETVRKVALKMFKDRTEKKKGGE